MNTTALPIDHLVILVSDLDAASADYRALGFNVQPGGTHAEGSTHNALVGFADGSYLELIAFLRPDPAHRWHPWAARGHEGFVDLALCPPSVGDVVQRVRAAGLAYQGPIDGGRIRPDGERLRWQIGTPPSRDLPFLCGDLTPRALRVREGAVRVHDNGVQGIASVTLLVADLGASAARWATLLGHGPLLPATPLSALGPHQAVFTLGPSRLVLVTPGLDDASQRLRQRLATEGEGLIGLALRGPASQSLPRDRTHGAAIEIVA